MSTRTHSGYLVLADISGFTSYVAQTELEHSQEILAELLELIVRQVRPVLTLSKLEGDAVFAYSTDKPKLSGERLLEAIEATYVAFRGRVEGIRQRTTCQCNACIRIPMLDLKFLTHHGEFMIQDISGTKELVGTDVNLVHRLAKNGVFDATDWNAYALYSEVALEHMGLPNEGMHASIETYEHLGDIQTYSSDLRTRYDEIIATREVLIDAENADFTITVDLPATQAHVWEWVTEPDKRNIWKEEAGVWSTVRSGSRMAAGAQYHCAHGDEVSIAVILDWRPFDYLTTEGRSSDDKVTMLDHIESTILTPLDDGQSTRITQHFRMTKRTILIPLVGFIMNRVFGRPQYAKLKESIIAEQQA